MPNAAASRSEAFWQHVVQGEGCWEWRGYILANGYGQSYYHGVRTLAHRLSYELHHGPIPTGMEVCHRCDNPPCVNPAHLFVGTHRDNMLDALAKGRIPPPPVRRGLANNKTKLTDGQVAMIRARFAAGGVSKSALAREFGIHHSRVWQLVNQKDSR